MSLPLTSSYFPLSLTPSDLPLLCGLYDSASSSCFIGTEETRAVTARITSTPCMVTARHLLLLLQRYQKTMGIILSHYSPQVLGIAKEKLANLNSSHQTHNLSWQHIVIEESDWSINIRWVDARLSCLKRGWFFLHTALIYAVLIHCDSRHMSWNWPVSAEVQAFEPSLSLWVIL